MEKGRITNGKLGGMYVQEELHRWFDLCHFSIHYFIRLEFDQEV